MKIALSVVEDDVGRRSIVADLAFDGPAKVLVFAWLNNEMWWAKSSAWQSQYRWSALASCRFVPKRKSRTRYHCCSARSGQDNAKWYLAAEAVTHERQPGTVREGALSYTNRPRRRFCRLACRACSAHSSSQQWYGSVILILGNSAVSHWE